MKLTRSRAARLALTVLVAIAVVACGSGTAAAAGDPALVSTYPAANPRGLMVTTGGWAYCLQMQKLANYSRYTLLCGRYVEDGYTGFGLRDRRHLDWGNPAYLASLARKAGDLHRKIGGKLVLIGVSYSGFGVATLASHHPELRPDRLIVLDAYFDLVARRGVLRPTQSIAQEIDGETGGTTAALRARSARIGALARLVRNGMELTVVWSISDDEARRFAGATCNRDANAAPLARLALALGRPVVAWVTRSKHGHDLWDSGRRIVAGQPPGRRVTFRPGRGIPPGTFCS